MSEKAKRFIHLEIGKDKREFICKIGDKPLKECIEEDINRYYINKKETRLINEEVLNCLKAILITCVGKSNFDFNATTSQIKIIVQDRNENEMEIVEMELFISLDEKNELLVNKINDCLKL
jgi:pantothenate kinase